MKNYTINYTGNGITITITKSFAKEAGVYNSEAYNILKGLRADFPDCKVELKKIKRNPEKKTYGKLTYERMEKYIIFVEGKDTATLKEFETVKIMATFKSSPYAYTKKWFLARYPEFECEAVEEKAESAMAETEETKELSIVENKETREVA